MSDLARKLAGAVVADTVLLSRANTHPGSQTAALADLLSRSGLQALEDEVEMLRECHRQMEQVEAERDEWRTKANQRYQEMVPEVFKIAADRDELRRRLKAVKAYAAKMDLSDERLSASKVLRLARGEEK